MTAAVAGMPGGGLGKEEQPQDPGGPGASEGVTPLMYACQQGRDHTVRQILHRKPNSIQERDRTGKTALHYCAENPTLACIDQVVEADPSLLKARDEDGYTPLHLATIAGNRTVVKYLLTKDADVKALDNEKHTVVHWATVCGEVELLDLLIEAGADPSTPDIHGAYPLHYAAQMCGPNSEMGNDVRVGLMVLRKLLQRGVDVSVTDHDGRQPLLWAASAEVRPSHVYCPSGSADAILALINAGASVSAEDKDGLTALHCAASRGHLDCLDCLVNFCGAEVDTLDSNGCTPLFYAVTLGHADCTQLLLHHGAHPDKQDRKGRTPAHCGAAKGQLETLKLLHRKGADLWKRNVKGDLPLHEACQSGRKDLVLWLLSMRPDTVNAPNLDGRCPLHIAAINNNIEMCKILMDKQAAVNPIMRNSRGQLLTPLDAGVARGNRGCAKYLQLHGGVAASKLTDKHALQKAMQRRRSSWLPYSLRALETKQHSNTGATPSELTADDLVSSSASSALKSNRSTMTASPVNTEAQTDTVDLKNKENMERKVTQRDAQTGTSEVNIRKLVLEEEAAELARKKAEEQRIAEEKNEEEEEQGKQKTTDKETDEEENKRKQSVDKEESQTEGDAEGNKKASADEEEIDESKRDSVKKEESEDGAGASGSEEKGGEDPDASGSVPEDASGEPGGKASSREGSIDSDGNVEEEGAKEKTKGSKNEGADDGDGEDAGKNEKTEESEDTNRTSQEALQRKSEEEGEEGGQTQVGEEDKAGEGDGSAEQNVGDAKDNDNDVDASVPENAEAEQGKKDGEEAEDNETDGDKKDSNQETQDSVDGNEDNKNIESDQSVQDSNKENGDEEDTKDGKVKTSDRKVSIAKSGSEGSGEGGSLDQDASLSPGEEGSASSAQNTVISNTSKQQSSLEEEQEGSSKIKSKKSMLGEHGKTIEVDEDETEVDGGSATEQEESAGKQANNEGDDGDKELSGKDVSFDEEEGDEEGYEDQEDDGQETEEGQNGQRATRAAGVRARPKSAVRPGTLSKKVGNRKTKGGGAGKRASVLKRRSTQDDSRGDNGEPVHKNTTRRVSISRDLPHLGSLRDTQEDDEEGVERPPGTASEERSHEMLLESSGRDFLTVDAAPPGLSSPSSTHGRDTGDSGFKESGYSDTLAVERDSDVDGPTDPERHTEDEDTPQASRKKTKTRRRRNKEREERYGAGAVPEDGRAARTGRGDGVGDDDDERGPRKKRDLRARQEGVDATDEAGRGTDDSPPGTFDEDEDDEEADEDALRKLGVTSHRRPGVRRGQVRSGAMSGGPKKVENMESSLRRRSRKAASPSTEVSITQAMQNTMRKYALERRLFQQLLELKRMQIRNTRANEHVLIKRMVDSFHKEGNLLGIRGYGGPYSFSSYEKYLYDQLRFLQSSQGVKIPAFRPSDDVEKLSRAIRRAEIKELPEPLMTHRDPSVCNHTTHRCHHAAHAYTGVPCAAYIGYHRRRKASNNNNNNNNNKQVSLPRIAGSTAGGGTAGGTAGASPAPPQDGARVAPGEPIGLRNYDPKKPLTVELQHGLARQQIVLPTDILDKNKKYHLTFSIKPSTPVPAVPHSPLREEVVPAERSASAPEIIDTDTLAPDARQELLHSAPPEGRTEA
ncbi:uncharacterized protein [Panulirus ornatus]|uniref:uncharacterized protein isoform X2 n=1 Tax=Panulirus ornatus TaxID=150431 RepID=UPI003A88FD39